MDEERDLVTAYRTVKKVAPPHGQGLNDLYVRFFRIAERRITEGPEGRGIVCFISNYSWLDGLSFTGMRERYLEVFDEIWIDCLNGDKYKTGKLTPDGLPDPSVFSTEHNREGIQVGTAVALLARGQERSQQAQVRFRDHLGRGKLGDMLELGLGKTDASWDVLTPSIAVGLPLVRSQVNEQYGTWPKLPELCPDSSPGVQTKRDDLVVDIDLEVLKQRMGHYFNPGISDEDMRRACPRAMEDTARFPARAARATLVARGLLPDHFHRYLFRPMDVRWVYLEPETKLLGEKSPAHYADFSLNNHFLVTTGRTRKDVIEPSLLTRLLTDLNAMDSGARCAPVHRAIGTVVALQRDDMERSTLNASEGGWRYLHAQEASPEQLMRHVHAVLNSRTYRVSNAGAIRHGWPRIQLPATSDAILDSAELGSRVAALLDVEEPVDAVTTGSIRHELRPVSVLASVSGGQLDPSAGDLAVTAGWGHGGRGGVTMPGRGRVVERPYTDAELAAFREGLADLGLSYDQLTACLGGACYDVYLSDVAYWRCVPARVWKYTIGGYQVMKKWLSYRERALLGRDLAPDEARYVTEMARRIAAILLLEPALDANYMRVKADTYEWPARQHDW